MGWWSRRGGALAAGAVWAGLVLGIAIHGFFYPRAHTVFDIYAPASRQWWAGENLYLPGADYYRYSPLFAIAITPFTPPAWGPGPARSCRPA
jgi:hypothetical protein